MIVYLDLLFIFNFIVNCLCLYLLELTYHEKISRLRVVCGGVVGGFLIFVFLTNYVLYFICKLLGGVLVAFIGMEKRNPTRVIVKAASFYLINYASVGIISAFKINRWYFFIAAFTILIILLFLENNKKTDIFINSLQYNISVTFIDKIIKTSGYLDTGNFSRSDDMPVVFMAKKYCPSDIHYKSITLHTLGGLTHCKVFKPTAFQIEINNSFINCDVLVAFGDLRGFDCLLNADLFIMEGGKNVKEGI